MLRSRHSVTTCWRSVPGAEGIAMITSSGCTPSSTRAQLGGTAQHLDAGDAHALLARVVVHEADRRAAQAGVAAQLERHLLASVAGPDDQHLVRRPLEDRPARRALHDRAHREARAAHEHEREQEVEREHATRRVVTADREQEQHDDQPDGRDHDRLQDRLEVLLVDEAPELRVEPEHREDHELHRDREGDRVPQQLARSAAECPSRSAGRTRGSTPARAGRRRRRPVPGGGRSRSWSAIS